MGNSSNKDRNALLLIEERQLRDLRQRVAKDRYELKNGATSSLLFAVSCKAVARGARKEMSVTEINLDETWRSQSSSGRHCEESATAHSAVALSPETKCQPFGQYVQSTVVSGEDVMYTPTERVDNSECNDEIAERRPTGETTAKEQRIGNPLAPISISSHSPPPSKSIARTRDMI